MTTFSLRSTTPSAAWPPTAGLVVCEKSGQWAQAWRRELGSGTRVVEARFVDDAWQQLQRFPHGALAMELRAEQSPQLVALLARVQAERPHVLCVAHLTSESPAWELLLREAGALAIIASPRRMATAVTMLHKHLARAPQPNLSFREAIWRQLPWSETPLPPASIH
ncbi:MAG TPA: hypothetical protein VL096_02525 [Pirellulaceae bacterium]|nr:hypothetical protein [Pirellulaceae bacterium]